MRDPLVLHMNKYDICVCAYDCVCVYRSMYCFLVFLGLCICILNDLSPVVFCLVGLGTKGGCAMGCFSPGPLSLDWTQLGWYHLRASTMEGMGNIGGTKGIRIPNEFDCFELPGWCAKARVQVG